MQLKLFKTMWGFPGGYAEAVRIAKKQGYDGLEGPVPASRRELGALANLLEQNSLHFIAEIATTGTYVPDRSLPMQSHIDHLQADLQRCATLKPLFITCLGGCDAWPVVESINFFQQAMALADSCNLIISFETHRGRSLFNPWITRDIVAVLPQIKLTCDFSHWDVVCEGLQRTEEEIIQSLLTNAWHVHGRVGYDQGPQVPDPSTPPYRAYLQQYTRWWQWIWQEHKRRQKTFTSVTPEFGPDGYVYRDINCGKALVDIDVLNRRLADHLRSEFQRELEAPILMAGSVSTHSFGAKLSTV